MHSRHHEVSQVPYTPRKFCLTLSRFEGARSPSYTKAKGVFVTVHLCPERPKLMDRKDRPPLPPDGLRPEVLPRGDEKPRRHYTPYPCRPAGPEFDHVSMLDYQPVLSEHDRKLAKAEVRRKACKCSKKCSKKTEAEKKAASEKKAAAKKREQEVYNLFWGIPEWDARCLCTQFLLDPGSTRWFRE
jgi:hypothetical protein